MNRIALSAALVLSLAAPAFASDQLANQLNVEPGVYTTAELVSLRNAIENDDHAAANAIRSNPGGFGGADAATVQAAALNSAEQDDEHAAASYIRKNGVAERVNASSKSGVSAGQGQLAASLGVDAADYTLAELIQLKSVQSSNNGRDS